VFAYLKTVLLEQEKLRMEWKREGVPW
jgi:hypothetical protein